MKDPLIVYSSIFKVFPVIFNYDDAVFEEKNPKTSRFVGHSFCKNKINILQCCLCKKFTWPRPSFTKKLQIKTLKYKETFQMKRNSLDTC